ncbi:serine hydrolase domain-containing protein [Sphingomonas sp.]|jgi:CubicO group peptidase (beta-lactamase class C family)|uniref:serine hydrolase domain-containing protein n=1 Tax=Sphingomonas sp. TaxID=28214 RepID=UPI002DE8D5F3|nr:serine hydrolase domain-containing protein [Sphingomonas sp.]
MRKLVLLAAATLLACGPAPAQRQGPVKLTADNSDRIRQAGGEILFWDQAQRDRNFPAMEKLFPGTIAQAPRRPIPLRAGKPLRLEGVETFMAANNTAGLIIVQDGRIRLERYARGYSRKGRYTSFSVAKSLTSTLVGAAVRDGFIKSVDDPVTRYIPALAGSAYEGVTVRQVLTMTSGVKWNEDYTDPNSDVARMYAKPVPSGVDPTVAYLRTLTREAAPGSKWVYKTGETNLIGVLVTKVTGKSLTDYAEGKIWRPFGMERPLFWMIDQSGQNIGGCCLSASLRDYARIGLFALGGGKGVVPEGWFADATKAWSPIGSGRGYGYQWWIEPEGSFQAQGIFGQMIHVDPSRRLVIALSSAWPRATGRDLSVARAEFVQRIKAAIDAERR